MDIEAIKKAAQAGGFADLRQLVAETETSCVYEYHNSEPCPDFWELLPNKVINPNTGKEVFISQSLLKSLRKVIEKELCPKRFYHTVITNQAEEKSGDAMLAGQRFEYELTGAPNRDNRIPDQILTKKTKQISTEQVRISNNAEAGKETLKRLGLLKESNQYQVRVSTKCLEGHFDLLIFLDAGGGIVVDIKYSGLMDEGTKYNPLSWYPKTVHEKFSHRVQALHYLLLARTLPEVQDLARFMFLVFDSRTGHEGEYRVFEIEPTEEAMNQHKWLILGMVEQFQNMLNGKEFTALPSYDQCKNCPVLNCKEKQEWPEVVKVRY